MDQSGITVQALNEMYLKDLEKKIADNQQFQIELSNQISYLTGLVQSLNHRFSWEEKETETGIKIAGGPTTITRTGTYLGTTAIPTPQGVAVVMILKEDHTGRLAMLSPELLKPL